jgi:hypothetical protein
MATVRQTTLGGVFPPIFQTLTPTRFICSFSLLLTVLALSLALVAVLLAPTTLLLAPAAPLLSVLLLLLLLLLLLCCCYYFFDVVATIDIATRFLLLQLNSSIRK